MAMQNLGSPMQLGFPISNYTMSMALLERIDFWDTTEDAIGEDFHMFVKAYFKTNGQVDLPGTFCIQNCCAGWQRRRVTAALSWASGEWACSGA
jgi:hypothetical protein